MTLRQGPKYSVLPTLSRTYHPLLFSWSAIWFAAKNRVHTWENRTLFGLPLLLSSFALLNNNTSSSNKKYGNSKHATVVECSYQCSKSNNQLVWSHNLKVQLF